MKLTPVRRELQQWRQVEIKACMTDDGADNSEEGVIVVEVIGDESLYEG